MTAEIAIINRSAVTLATDSAVTLTVRGNEKIYNSADKLFELSDNDPIGIMVYNNLEYMGVSWELAVKQFRRRAGRFAHVVDAAEAFFKYLLEDLAPDDSLQRQHAKAILHPAFADIRALFDRKVTRALEESNNPRKVDLSAIFTDTVRQKTAEADSASIPKCLADVTVEAIAEFYSEPLGPLVKDVFDNFPLDEKQKLMLRQLGAVLLHRDVLSDSFTGLVFAGFGENETFPSLIAYKLDGVVFGRLKKRETDRVTTNRSEVTGQILPFAQREMVDRFLYGIDPVFERVIERYVEAVMGETGKVIIASLPRRTSKATKEKLTKSIANATDAAVTNWRNKMIPLFKDRFVREVQDMIFLMPKQELAALAQELINLTSVKRRFSSGRESVGGPIDVAVISKVDGFVWVRRKHYFEPNLNPRYFHRKFGSVRN